MDKEEYGRRVKAASPPSPVGKDCCFAFLFGGSICTLGQFLGEVYQGWGLSLPDARTAVSVTLIFLSAALTALGWYDQLAKYGGAGTLVPVTGFANAVVSPAIDFRSEGFVTGMAARMFTVAGPVIVYGVIASAIYGLILCLF